MANILIVRSAGPLVNHFLRKQGGVGSGPAFRSLISKAQSHALDRQLRSGQATIIPETKPTDWREITEGTPIEKYQWDTRVLNILSWQGEIKFMEQLEMITANELLGLHNFGRKSLLQVTENLARFRQAR
jgi:DNA-directed RNA polymerase alpha subunit